MVSNAGISENIREIIPISIIGYGKSSIVINTRQNKRSGAICAVKIIDKKNSSNLMNKLINTSITNNYENEIKIITQLSKYDHKNIVKYMKIFESGKKIYICQELSNTGELNPAFFKSNIIYNLSQLCNSIHFLHTLNIIHRDIKPSNFLIFGDTIKLTDFDTCFKLSDQSSSNVIFNQLIGTPLFIPPELISLSNPTFLDKLIRKENPFALDYWSLGVSLHYLLYEKYPFYAKNEYKLFNQILNLEINTPEITEPSEDAKILMKIIKNLLLKAPNKRYSLAKIFKIINYQPASYSAAKGVDVIKTDYDLETPCTDNSKKRNNESIDNDEDLSDICDDESGICGDTGQNDTQKFKFNIPMLMSPKKEKTQSQKITSKPQPQPQPQPPVFNGRSKLKHSTIINFKNFQSTISTPNTLKSVPTHTPVMDDIDSQIAQDYKSYTMEEYLDAL